MRRGVGVSGGDRGGHASYETERNIFSGDAYDVVMHWQAPVDGPLQYLWTVRYQYDGTRESNLLSCDLSSQPCQAADPDRGRALALLPPALLATSSPPIFAYGAPMACVFCEPR